MSVSQMSYNRTFLRKMCLNELGLVLFRVSLQFYFIPSSEFNAHLKQIKVILSAVKKYRNFH